MRHRSAEGIEVQEIAMDDLSAEDRELIDKLAAQYERTKDLQTRYAASRNDATQLDTVILPS